MKRRHICGPDHKHEQTTTCRVHHKCECAPCRVSYNERRKEWAPRSRDRVPAAPIALHVKQLLKQGATSQAIAHRSGVSIATIVHLTQGRYERVASRTAARLLAVKGVPRNTVAAHRVTRRIGALLCLGYSVYSIAERSGVSATGIRRAMAGEFESFGVTFAAPIFRLYEELTVPFIPSSARERQSRTHALKSARSYGCVPAAAWDHIDDPREVPKGVLAA